MDGNAERTALMDGARNEADAALAGRAKAGDRAAFGELYARHRAAVFGYFRARVLVQSDAEDLVQEVFLRVFGAVARFNMVTPFQAWLLGICRNVFREHARKGPRRRETGWTELCLEIEDLAPPESLYSDVAPMLPECLEKLGDAARDSLRWHYLGGMPVKGIAEKLGRNVGAVKVLMVRARQAVKRCLHGRLGEA